MKARHLQVFTRWLIERFGGRFAGMRREPLGPIRREVLRVPGLGPETADAILLYAANRPVFVADAYTRRVLARHGFLDARAGYEDARAFIEEHLPSDPVLFNEYHALLVAVAKSHCRTVAHCETCPLRFDLDRPRSLIARRTPGSASPAVPPRRERRGSARARPSL